ncbi:hypothetical protein PVL29_009156 [Vitis rotundifolia]|uniref:Uncharacterized protein n=1 Tax=Vitis rotundifolia TaxID=103349 RepID=A0AA38ZXQ2_VITRO|nr:hypothetical protein PVL29_009156 [Vitis rotundifolia]
MEGMEAQSSSSFANALYPSQLFNEDILPCINVIAELMAKMKATGSKGRLITRMYYLKQAILLFVHARLAVNSDHRFVFTAMGKTTSWLEREFNNESDSAITTLQVFFAHPQHQWPVNPKFFTLDVVYFHDEPGPVNSPQKVYDAPMDSLERVTEQEKPCQTSLRLSRDVQGKVQSVPTRESHFDKEVIELLEFHPLEIQHVYHLLLPWI